MQALINSYSPTAETAAVSDFNNFTVDYNFNSQGTATWSLIFKSPSISGEVMFNGRIFESLKMIEALENNWDEEGSPAPDRAVLQMTEGIIHSMTAVGQEIYNIAPGPHGEIMLNFRNGDRSMEILIYPDKMKYVKFPTKGTPSQGVFTPDMLFTDLIAWLNAEQ